MDKREDRLWLVLLVVGGVFATGLLGRQIADFWMDRHQPAMQQNDAIAALGSVAMLAIVAVVAARRLALRRAAQQSPRLERKRTRRSVAAKKGVPVSGMPSKGVPVSGMPSKGVPVSGMPSKGLPVSGKASNRKARV